ncbi:unnamed protein product [Urochloa decumbens]|uniref:Uncharacterized protein n=1 Tax=Urochloa decumbens TaxID=240449 RepID=A0ABC8XYF9_9POAL
MGNCQTAEAAAVVIQHPPPGGRVERAHGALSAAAVMAANPGHYVAAVIPADEAAADASRATKKRRLKLLRPDDALALGDVYRLVSFEEVLREFVSKRHATLLSRAVVADGEAHRPESEDRSPLAKEQEGLHRGEETTKPKRPVARRAILHRRHQMEMMGHLNSKQGTDLSMANKATLPSPDQTATSSSSSPLDPTANSHRPSDPERDFDAAALVMLGGRFGLARHGQWRPALPSIAEGSVVC